MPLDAICLEALVDELRDQIVGARIDKVFQPERDELGLALRGQNGNVRLLISANPSNARVHITQQSRENPSAPPMFCMLMRKHLVGARIMEITQPPAERVVQFHVDVNDEMGERVRRVLVAELMGRHSNLILVDAENRIIDCLKRVDHEMSEMRPVLPGLFYHLPPAQTKADPHDLASWRSRWADADGTDAIESWMVREFSGLSPLVARELLFQTTGQTALRFCEMTAEARQTLLGNLEKYVYALQQKIFEPCLLMDGDTPTQFSYVPILQYGDRFTRSAPETFSELLDVYFTRRDAAEHRQKRAAGLRKTVQNALDRTKRKLALQASEYAATLNREHLRVCGDLLMANLHTLKRGQPVAIVQDFYDPETPMVEIPLNVTLSPQQNAAKYYKDYTKAKTAQEVLQLHMEKGRTDVVYLESVLEAIERVTGESDINEIREELSQTGFLPQIKGKKKGPAPSKPLVFRSTTGMMIYVGRNNRQNDELTLKTADKTDMWLHVQKIAGSHVIINCEHQTPDDKTLEEAAILAATHSQGKNGQKVPVDYTAVKNVKKMSGGKPGMVIYDKFQTVFVDPSTALAETLRVK